jgi:TatD DNase family protein
MEPDLMPPLPTLDTHAHFSPTRSAEELAAAGAVLAMTLSLQAAAEAAAWGVGCHPRSPKAQGSFNPVRFRDLAARSAVVGEIGLDTSSRIPLQLQLHTFRQILEILSTMPRILSIHSYSASGLVLQELRRTPVSAPILHCWTGSDTETREAVGLGCYFSIHPSIARHSKFRTLVPRERLLFESDQGEEPSPAAIPHRIQQAEERIARQLGMEPEAVRQLGWQNFAALLRQTATRELLPPGLVEIAEASGLG